MLAWTRDSVPVLLFSLPTFVAAGCGGDTTPPAKPAAVHDSEIPAQSEPASADSRPKPTLRPVTVAAAAETAPPQDAPLTGEQKANTIMQALRPLQVLIGNWRGITFKEIGGAKAVEEPQWIWDLRTDREQPALVMNSMTSPYFESSRLTFLPDKQCYQLATVDRDGNRRTYEGRFVRPVEDIPGDDRSLQRTYELEFVQVEPATPRKLAKVVLHQQDNNRYLLEVFDRRGDQFVKYDTVGNQREGTSFALSDSEYGEKTCIVSQGLGTISVTHGGRTYYVCCTGCKAAFEDEPERWIAKATERK